MVRSIRRVAVHTHPQKGRRRDDYHYVIGKGGVVYFRVSELRTAFTPKGVDVAISRNPDDFQKACLRGLIEGLENVEGAPMEVGPPAQFKTPGKGPDFDVTAWWSKA